MNEQYILNLIKYGLDGNAHAVSDWATKMENDERLCGKTIFADRIKEEITKVRTITTFDQGWWNCFSSFAEEILCNGMTGSHQEEACIAVLKAAGITSDEAEAWLDSEEADLCQRTCEIVRQYWLSL